MLRFLIRNEIYKDDYENITSRILEEKVSYEVAIEAVKKIAVSGMFEQQSEEVIFPVCMKIRRICECNGK